jgi:hypothetical protein
MLIFLLISKIHRIWRHTFPLPFQVVNIPKSHFFDTTACMTSQYPLPGPNPNYIYSAAKHSVPNVLKPFVTNEPPPNATCFVKLVLLVNGIYRYHIMHWTDLARATTRSLYAIFGQIEQHCFFVMHVSFSYIYES